MNLLSNAIKFSRNGAIEIRAWTQRTRQRRSQSESESESLTDDLNLLHNANEHSSEEYLYVQVKDTGVGIPLENQKLLFREYGRIKETDHLNPNGVGLGLMIC